jgi:RNase adapter protein RapZ
LIALAPLIILPGMDLILISGHSGSGKSVALHLLEDAGYYCVDNLPVVMLTVLVRMLKEEGIRKVAVAIDARSGGGIDLLPDKLALLAKDGVRYNFLFLMASEDTLLKRYSESRRRHPLATHGQTLAEAIATERALLEPISALGHRIDTSDLKANALREWVRQFIDSQPGQGLTLMFESFGFKHGIPLDADLVFDVRCLPNPHYDPELRPLTGRDPAVAAFLEKETEVLRMRDDIQRFVADWLPAYIRDNRNYLTVAIGCTGGQHRSVYLAEWLGREFSSKARVLVRHRTLAGN